ncbi:hypothetical protein [Rubripirellula lacrimiformis]|nr:hypothetical protein [Rubripirellula lacrimiformis]
MNPYEPPMSGPAILSRTAPAAVSLRHWMAFVAIVIVKATCFGAFVFFAMIEFLGVGVNWPNVIPLLGAAALVLAIAHKTQTTLLHNSLNQWPQSSFPYLLGAVLGVIASACARAGLI